MNIRGNGELCSCAKCVNPKKISSFRFFFVLRINNYVDILNFKDLFSEGAFI